LRADPRRVSSTASGRGGPFGAAKTCFCLQVHYLKTGSIDLKHSEKSSYSFAMRAVQRFPQVFLLDGGWGERRKGWDCRLGVEKTRATANADPSAPLRCAQDDGQEQEQKQKQRQEQKQVQMQVLRLRCAALRMTGKNKNRSKSKGNSKSKCKCKCRSFATLP
jgi:hypothetical protein